jgi:peptidoglycan/LPS O-acetylase OafA/YrhL
MHDSQNRKTIEGIQYLRGFAALAVLIHHTLEETSAIERFDPADWVVRYGAAGVDVFFVISGFVILSSILAREVTGPSTSASFILDRVRRIFPFYWVCAAAVLLIWLSGAGYRNLSPTLDMVFSALLLLPGSRMIIGVSWTLTFEMYFYTLVAVLMLTGLSLRQLPSAITVLIGSILLATSYMDTEGPTAEFFSNPIVLEFLFGVALAPLLRLYAPSLAVAMILLIAGVVLIGAGSAYTDNATTAGVSRNTRYIVWGIPAVLVFNGFYAIRLSEGRVRSTILLLGNASYAIYLTHPLVMVAYARALKTGRFSSMPLADLLVVVLLATVLGVAAHLYVEKPVTQAFRRITLGYRFASS